MGYCLGMWEVGHPLLKRSPTPNSWTIDLEQSPRPPITDHPEGYRESVALVEVEIYFHST
jgi:hypothetical protein